MAVGVVGVFGFGGSLRRGSFSWALLAPAGVTLDLFDRLELGRFPPFDQDLQESPPDVVRGFKARVRAADAVLISTPEYNYSIPGFLKNAIDWASRPYADNVFAGKPVAVMSASTGMLGGARAQYHLRQCFVFLNAYPINKPECIVPYAADKVDSGGRVTDEKTRERIGQLLEALVDWTRKLKE